MDVKRQKGVIERVEASERKVEVDVSKISKGDGSLVEEPEAKTLEASKKSFMEKIYELTNKEDFDKDPLKAMLFQILDTNKQILSIIRAEQNRVKLFKRLEKGELKIIKGDIVESNKAKKALLGLLEILPPQQSSSIGIKSYLDHGTLALNDIKHILEDVKGMDYKQLESAALIWNEFNDLRKTIQEENKIIRAIIRDVNPPYIKRVLLRIAKKKPLIKKEKIVKLSHSVDKELEVHNRILRDFGYSKIKIEEERQRLSKVHWLEEKQIKLIEDIKLLLNQFIISKLVFPSGIFVSFTCSQRDAMQIAGNGFIGADNLLPHNKRGFRVAYQKTELGFIPYEINNVALEPKKEDSIGFVFPLESVIKGRYFLAEQLNRGKLMVFGRPFDESLNKGISARYRDFDELLDDINKRFEEWVEEAKSIDKRFKISWTEKARKVINKDFAKRWLKQVATEFSYRGNIAYEILVTIFGDEDLLRMNMKQFIEAVKKSKDFYKKIVDSTTQFIEKASFEQDVSEGVLFLPRNQVLFWEKYFVKIGSRPNVYYYDEKNIRDGILKHWQECKMNKVNHKLLKTKEVQIYDLESDRPLMTD